MKKTNNWNWNEFFLLSFEEKEDLAKEAEELAAEWTTCACGNACGVLPKNKNGAPADNILNSHGLNFYYEIGSGHWDTAKKILVQIERRTKKLLKNMK